MPAGPALILAEVEFTPQTQGVLVSQGSRLGGYPLLVLGGPLHFIYNFLGIAPEQKLSAPAPASGRHIVGVKFRKESMSQNLESLGTMTLHIEDQAVGSGAFRPQSGHYALAGESLAVGRDTGDPVAREYQTGFGFSPRRRRRP